MLQTLGQLGLFVLYGVVVVLLANVFLYASVPVIRLYLLNYFELRDQFIRRLASEHLSTDKTLH